MRRGWAIPASIWARCAATRRSCSACPPRPRSWTAGGRSGRAADAVGYWDLVAELTTPTDMATWLPVAHDHGRADLDALTLNRRRDAFLRAALDHLDRQQSR